MLFQSTLPRGSDGFLLAFLRSPWYFNPRSLAGATLSSIVKGWKPRNFNPRSLAGATARIIAKFGTNINFNPRSLAGATLLLFLLIII